MVKGFYTKIKHILKLSIAFCFSFTYNSSHWLPVSRDAYSLASY